jgi:aldose 1-epimerase
VNASSHTPAEQDLIPSGEIAPVVATLYDFRAPRPLETSAVATDFCYDVNFVLDRAHAGLCWAATMATPDSKLWMEVHTTEPGLQVYDGSYLGASHRGLDGRFHFRHAGLCLEPGRFPDGPNHANFPSAVLYPGTVYRQRTQYRFGSGPANWRGKLA